MKTHDLVKAALFTVFISVCAQISIPSPIVPFTLQVFAISLSALVLSSKQFMFTVGTYITLGLIGIPVFAHGSGGFQTILSPTFGFILGFIPMGFVINKLSSSNHNHKPWVVFGVANLTLYIIALPILYLNLVYLYGLSDLSLPVFLTSYWLVFLPSDIVSFSLAIFIARTLRGLNLKG